MKEKAKKEAKRLFNKYLKIVHRGNLSDEDNVNLIIRCATETVDEILKVLNRDNPKITLYKEVKVLLELMR